MTSFLIKLLITIGIIWLTQTLIGTFNIGQPAAKVIFVVVVIIMVLWLVLGNGLGIGL